MQSEPTTSQKIDGKARKVAGEIAGDPDLETDVGAGDDAGIGPADDVGEGGMAAIAGAAKEAAGRLVGNRELAMRGRHERRRGVLTSDERRAS